MFLGTELGFYTQTGFFTGQNDSWQVTLTNIQGLVLDHQRRIFLKGLVLGGVADSMWCIGDISMWHYTHQIDTSTMAIPELQEWYPRMEFKEIPSVIATYTWSYKKYISN